MATVAELPITVMGSTTSAASPGAERVRAAGPFGTPEVLIEQAPFVKARRVDGVMETNCCAHACEDSLAHRTAVSSQAPRAVRGSERRAKRDLKWSCELMGRRVSLGGMGSVGPPTLARTAKPKSTTR